MIKHWHLLVAVEYLLRQKFNNVFGYDEDAQHLPYQYKPYTPQYCMYSILCTILKRSTVRSFHRSAAFDREVFKCIVPYQPYMTDQVVEVFLPDDPSIEDFHSLSAEDKLRVVRLGLAFLSEGTKHLQKWNNGDWESTIKAIEERAEMERDRLQEQLRISESQFDDYVHSSKVRQEALAKEISNSERQRCNAEIEHLRDQNTSLTTRIEKTIEDMQHLSGSLDDRHDKKLLELRDFYEEKIKLLDNKLEESRKGHEEFVASYALCSNNSSLKGQQGEEYVLGRLNMTFPKADIEDTHMQPGRGDFILREEGVTMMIETKNYTRNVQKSEIDKFYRDIDNPANSDIQCAALVSLTSGISAKDDFQFEIRNNIPVLFIHRLQNNFENILLAWKFFRLITAQSELDLGDREVCDGFKNMAISLKRNFTKMRKNADKHHTENLAMIAEQETQVMGLYRITGLKF